MLNHVEMIYRPGERDAARALFEALGFGVSDFGPWLVVAIDPSTFNGVDNLMYASEPVPAQRRFEAALERAIASDPEASAALEHYRSVRRAHPQFNFHFGATLPTLEDWTERTERLQEAVRTNPLLQGRVDISVFNPGDPGAVGINQTFALTDIIATGTLQTGVIFELQWYPSNEAGEVDIAALAAKATAPDLESIV
jgi:hypothetical protein